MIRTDSELLVTEKFKESLDKTLKEVNKVKAEESKEHAALSKAMQKMILFQMFSMEAEIDNYKSDVKAKKIKGVLNLLLLTFLIIKAIRKKRKLNKK